MKSILTLTVLTLISNANAIDTATVSSSTLMKSSTVSVQPTVQYAIPKDESVSVNPYAKLSVSESSAALVLLTKMIHKAKWGYFACADLCPSLAAGAVTAKLRCAVENDGLVAVLATNDLTKTPCFKGAVNGYPGVIPSERSEKITKFWKEYVPKWQMAAKVKDLSIYQIEKAVVPTQYTEKTQVTKPTIGGPSQIIEGAKSPLINPTNQFNDLNQNKF